MKLRITCCAVIMMLLISSIGCSQETEEAMYMNQPTPGNVPLVFNEGVVTYPVMNHSSVAITPDLKEMYWSKFVEGASDYASHLMVSRYVNGKWTKPEEAEFAKGYWADVPFITSDGNRIYFAAKRPNPLNGTQRKECIWFVQKTLEGWSSPQPLPNVINDCQLHWQFSVADNGNVYFSTDEGMKISRMANNEYQTPELVSKVLHPKYEGELPYIAPDESYILFINGSLPGTLGQGDIFIGYKLNDGSWSEPIHTGKQINTVKGEMCPMVSPDGEYMFYVSYIRGVFDIFWVKADFIEKLRPENSMN